MYAHSDKQVRKLLKGCSNSADAFADYNKRVLNIDVKDEEEENDEEEMKVLSGSTQDNKAVALTAPNDTDGNATVTVVNNNHVPKNAVKLEGNALILVMTVAFVCPRLNRWSNLSKVIGGL